MFISTVHKLFRQHPPPPPPPPPPHTHTHTSPYLSTVPIFDFQNLQKSGCPDFLEFYPVNIPVFKVIFKTQISIFQVFFLQIEKKYTLSIWNARIWICRGFRCGVQCTIDQVFGVQWASGVWWEALVFDGGGGGGGLVVRTMMKVSWFLISKCWQVCTTF